jgi:DNA-binding NarL/FixJ family response regulator
MPKRVVKIREDDLLRLYHKGHTDREIAEELCVSQSAVNYRREKLGLPSNIHANTDTDDTIASMNAHGLTDKEIAEKLGITQSTVNYRRIRMGLASNYERKHFSDESFLELYHTGMTDKEIALHIGVTPAAVNYRRDRLGLRSNSKPVEPEECAPLYYAGQLSDMIAESLSISRAAAQAACEQLELTVRMGAGTPLAQGTE